MDRPRDSPTDDQGDLTSGIATARDLTFDRLADPDPLLASQASRAETSGPVGMTDAERTHLKGASMSGVIITVVAQLVRFVLRFGYQIVIGRLLLPGDFGLVALAAPVISFIQTFADLGLSEATIQKKDISQAQLSGLFWLNIVTGAVLAGLCAIIAEPIARFYGDPRAAPIVMASGGLLLLSSFFSQHMALMNRHMRFKGIAVMDIATFLVGSAAGIASALLGAGYWAIIINQLVTNLVGLVMAWTMTGWMPGRPGRYSEMKPLIAFGGNMTSSSIIKFFSRNSDNILLGRFAGEYALGLYDRAFKLMSLPFGQVSAPFSRVAIPLLSRCRDEPEFYRRAFQRLLEAVLLLLYPALVFVVATCHELIVLALGQRWAEVTPIFAILGIDAFVAPLGNSMTWLFVSQGRTAEMRNYAFITCVLAISLFVIGLHWGPRGVAAGYATAGVTELCIQWPTVTRKGPLRRRDFVSTVAPFLPAVAISFAVLLGLRTRLPRGWLMLGAEAILSYIVFAASLVLMPAGRRVLRDVWQQVGNLGRRMALKVYGGQTDSDSAGTRRA